MRKKSGNADLLRIFDDELIRKAVKRTTEILEDPLSKRTEVLNAADKIIKFKFAFQDSVRRQALDQIEFESRQLKLEEQKIKMELLRGAADPNAKPEARTAYSAVFDPKDKPEGYYDPDPDEED
ncbi:hypothetical protein Aci011_025 [Acinetobacter phage vB_AbaM_B09_Aci01-1]|uniref:Uncharacterized protein n=3 Tax=Saclayvirus TaxID=2733128 RepID=A0A386KK32_9CAUD|nr:hypothetical protein HOU29_gp156 [Acinetobacter phage vB_AbaM_B09_Aci01-1]YP_009813248.1 hypothetical protein HOU30_gp164 [Acinetobacter phage vB_AbaM_B09_Aci02-2]YP_009813878.1 hypothetical protein HOU35_gp153 [Acinetobacter phage vB_AbaM_B09_Aci05]QMP18978.1 hypothetical protein FKOIJHOC_00018 [Acinetobacter phage Ab_121]AYD82395.1 hypothetical protein Aci05_024 [Acinetobacter phage vB_AbaM_B09_Aci05]AYD85612.1 hypothetical protein Aci011_025 [Acinetobacter phage vB_AbaM_B09_Aci01-1]AYD8